MNDLNTDALERITSTRNHQQRSELTQEVISYRPNFIERWALVLFLFFLILLFFSSWLIRYPEIIKAEATLTGASIPKEIVSKHSGKILECFVKNNQNVVEGQTLAWIEATANHQEVTALSQKLESCEEYLEEKKYWKLPALFLQDYRNLGELQSDYQTFIQGWQLYDDYVINGFFTKKMGMINSDISSLETSCKHLEEQKALLIKDLQLAKSTFEMNSTLYEDKVISLEEFRQAKSKFLSKQLSLPQIDIEILNANNQISQKKKEIFQLSHDVSQQQQIFEQTLRRLKSSVKEWLRTYTLQSPSDGRLVLSQPLQTNYYIEANTSIGYTNPDNIHYYVELKINQANLGKIDTGMHVNLHFDAYPYSENGSLGGTIQYISNIPIENHFKGVVRLDDGLNTNQKRTILYKPGLNAQALIITKDLRLIQRIYYSTYKVMFGD